MPVYYAIFTATGVESATPVSSEAAESLKGRLFVDTSVTYTAEPGTSNDQLFFGGPITPDDYINPIFPAFIDINGSKSNEPGNNSSFCRVYMEQPEYWVPDELNAGVLVEYESPFELLYLKTDFLDRGRVWLGFRNDGIRALSFQSGRAAPQQMQLSHLRIFIAQAGPPPEFWTNLQNSTEVP